MFCAGLCGVECVIVYGYGDAVKLGGHSCPTLVSARLERVPGDRRIASLLPQGCHYLELF